MRESEINFEEEVKSLLRKATKEKDIKLETPPNPEFGDYAFPCFELAKKLGKNPADVSKKLKESLKPSKHIREIKNIGPYLNFFVKSSALVESVLKRVKKEGKEYGKGAEKKFTVMVEFFHANTHKGVHIGHIRNISLGSSLCNTLEFNGYKVVRVNYQGDIGPHVAKCLWGIKNLKLKPPEKNKGLWLGQVYAMANEKIKQNPELEEEIRVLTKKLYDKDKEIMPLWQETRKWCLDDFEEFYKEFGVKFDRLYFESETEYIGRKIAKELLKKGVAKKSEGAIILDLKKYNLGVFVILRSDGVGLYSTKDFGLAVLKQKEFKIDKSVHVVGKEQELYFKQLFKSFELIGMEDFAKKSYHLIYDLVMLPEGKMSSREGTLVLYYELRKKLLELAESEVRKRHAEWGDEKVKNTAKSIAIGALKFSMLSRENNRIIIFDWRKALDFEGETGPYVQYAHARISSILRKYGKQISSEVDYTKLKEKEEQHLVMLLKRFPRVVEEAAQHYKPHLVARYALELAQGFNEYYHQHRILQAEPGVREARLLLVNCIRQVLSNSLRLLGIDALEEM